MKIKKDVKPQIQNLPVLKVKYTLVVPLMGIVDTLTMVSFYRSGRSFPLPGPYRLET